MNPKFVKDSNYHLERSKPFFGISCWHCNEEESLSMWNSYVKDGKGVAIESDVESLILALENTHQEIFIGLVEYLNHSETSVTTTGVEFARYLIKDRSFFLKMSYEQSYG